MNALPSRVARSHTESPPPPATEPLRWIERNLDRIVQRQALEEGFSQLQARLLAARFRHEEIAGGVRSALHPALARLDQPLGLPDLERAVERITRAITTRERILLCTDVDVDGATAHALLYAVLTRSFGIDEQLISSEVSHKTREGYGLTDPVVDRILARTQRPHLVLTADQASTDEPRIGRLRDANIDVVVTDHHAIAIDGPPASAVAVVNPARADSRYPDAMICGCHVAFLVMAAVRQRLIAQAWLPANAPSLSEYLDLVAVATVADCVSMRASANNRALVTHGLRRLNSGARPCWAALAPSAADRALSATDIAFTVGPRINARARMSEPMAAVHCLLATVPRDAQFWASLLDADNAKRKEVEAVMKAQALRIAAEQIERGAKGLCIYLPDGHNGVSGIVAARCVEAFGRPTICLAPRPEQAGVLSGSARTVDGFHVRDAFDRVAAIAPGLLRHYGGHAGAGGLSMEAQHVQALQRHWNDVVAASPIAAEFGPRVQHDGPLPLNIAPSTLEELAALDPYGRQFETPLFEAELETVQARWISKRVHLRLLLRDPRTGQDLDGVWFNAPQGLATEVVNARRARYAVQIARDSRSGLPSLQVRAAEPIGA